MAYIGKSPTIGNFQKCDAISVVNGQAAYTLQVGGVNVSPESVNHCLVSLNGILQAPTDSFTVSGSTLTFASNLATGDVIDFVMILGNVLDLGVPSDATVTDAKTNFVSTSSAAGLQIKGDGTTDGTLQLNCSQNSHGIKLKSPAHSAGASYTLTFPTTDGNANEFLQTNGSGTLTWAAAGGITEADMFRLSADRQNDGDLTANFERVDDASFSKIGTGMTESSGIFSFATTGLYQVMTHSTFVPDSSGDTCKMNIKGTTNNSSYDDLAAAAYGSPGARDGTVSTSTFVNVTDTSNVKVKFTLSSMSGSSTCMGSTVYNRTCFIFIRLGDSQ